LVLYFFNQRLLIDVTNIDFTLPLASFSLLLPAKTDRNEGSRNILQKYRYFSQLSDGYIVAGNQSGFEDKR